MHSKELKLALEEQLEYSKSHSYEELLSFFGYSILPEVADLMIENENDPNIFSEICKSLFIRSDSNLFASTLEKAARKKVELCGVSNFDFISKHIALHLNTNIDTLKYLFELQNNYINSGLANNPNTPKVILDKLADIEDLNIDEALIFNPNATEEIRQKVYKRYKEGILTCGYYYDHRGIKVKASGN